MDDLRIARRRFVLTAIAATTAAVLPRHWLPGNEAWAGETPNPAFGQLARRLFPHPGMADAVYAEVIQSVFDSFAAESGNLLDTAESALDKRSDGNWFDADADTQIAAVRGIENEAFFTAILEGLRGTFYNHPEVWSHLDYPGSSKQHGGYKYRGFDDIDWLPEVD